ncbi:MAG: HAD-IA family hydrolase [bacterium]
MIKLFIFGFEGVMVPWHENTLLVKMAEYLEVSPQDFKNVYDENSPLAKSGTINLNQLYIKIFKELPIKNKQVDKAISYHEEQYFKNMERKDKTMMNLVSQLRTKRRLTCIVNPEITPGNLEARFEFDKLFHQTYFSSSMKMGKEDPRILKDIMEDQGISPGNTVFIDHDINNVMMANKLGINGIYYDHISSLVKAIYELIKND